MSIKKVYEAWINMRQRCYNEKNPEFFRYGGVGICVDPRWDDFDSFLDDLGIPCQGMSLDRIDPKGDYTPFNCRWSDKAHQSYNQKKKKNNLSGKSGVKEYKGCRWRAYIGFKGKQYHLGYFDSFEDAVQVREKAELEFYGYTKD